MEEQDQKSIDAIGSVPRFSTTSRHCKANNSWKNQHTEQLYVIYIYVIYVWHMMNKVELTVQIQQRLLISEYLYWVTI